jgi:hypothetical protein
MQCPSPFNEGLLKVLDRSLQNNKLPENGFLSSSSLRLNIE